MQISTIRQPLLQLAIGVPLMLAGCATRESVDQLRTSSSAATAAADAHAASADQHAVNAQTAADQANALGTNAMGAAQTADQKASVAQAGLIKANARISYLEHKLLPHHKKVRHRHHPANHATNGKSGA